MTNVPIDLQSLTVLCQNRPLLKVPALKAKSGEVMALLGPSGQGKSSLLNILAGLSTQYTGSLYSQGEDMSAWSAPKRRAWREKSLIYIPQNGILLPNLTVRQFLNWLSLQKNETTSLEKQEEVLAHWGLLSCRHQKIQTLSGGQKQRLSLISLYQTKADLWLLDEPTAALDEKNALKVMQDLKDWAKSHQITVIIATHDDRILNLMDRIFRIQDGVLQ